MHLNPNPSQNTTAVSGSESYLSSSGRSSARALLPVRGYSGRWNWEFERGKSSQGPTSHLILELPSLEPRQRRRVSLTWGVASGRRASGPH